MSDTAAASYVLSAAAVAGRLPDDPAAYAKVFSRPGIDVGFYVLTGPDPQQPHRRPELYLVAEGSGVFEHGGRSTPFGPGDLIFVPAGEPHRFTGFGARMATWVVFYEDRPDEERKDG